MKFKVINGGNLTRNLSFKRPHKNYTDHEEHKDTELEEIVNLLEGKLSDKHSLILGFLHGCLLEKYRVYGNELEAIVRLLKGELSDKKSLLLEFIHDQYID